ncbi:hypothetical protein DY000_02031758 [Brassica cretica]|uniref:Uncharacterized protein n=1 Tax=Brassica cretica TaxID=69181 RepID=A0ABQ7DU36_BRACR|nr:hypothetical protein DY000_02031758 [Brassica cretica]
MNVFTKSNLRKDIFTKSLAVKSYSNLVLGSKTVTTKLMSKPPQKQVWVSFCDNYASYRINVTTKDLEIKFCSSLGWIKHKLSQGNGNVSKPATDKLECDDQNTDKPSSVTTQLQNMRTARSLRTRSLRSDRARVPLSRYIATELSRNVEYDTNPCIFVDSLMLSPEDRSKPISCFSTFEIINRTLR